MRVGSTDPLVWACGVCGTVHCDQELAGSCCSCYFCGEEIDNSSEGRSRYFARKTSHDACHQMDWVAREAKRLAEATEVTYDGEMILWGQDWVHGPDELVDLWVDADMVVSDYPEFVFASYKVPYKGIEVDSALEQSVEMLEDGIDHLKHLDALDAAVREFNDANKEFYWWEESRDKKWRVSSLLEGVELPEEDSE